MVWRSCVILHALFARGVVGRRTEPAPERRRPEPARSGGAARCDRGQHVALGDAAILAGARERSPASTPLSAARRDRRRQRLGRSGGGFGERQPSELQRRAPEPAASGGRSPAAFAAGWPARAGAIGDRAEQRADARRSRRPWRRSRRARRRPAPALPASPCRFPARRAARRPRRPRPAFLNHLADGGLGDGFAEGGYADFGHAMSGLVVSFSGGRVSIGPKGENRYSEKPMQIRRLRHNSMRRGIEDQPPSASSRNALSCAECFDIRPVAVAAEAGRPT